MKLKVKKLHHSAKLPVYSTPGAACFDLFSTSDITIKPGDANFIKTDLSFEVPPGHVMLVYSRSGHGFKHGIRLVNCVGVIDSDYRGEVLVGLHNDGAESFHVRPGDRVAQAMVVPAPAIELEEVGELSTTHRGAAGLGSTGA